MQYILARQVDQWLIHSEESSTLLELFLALNHRKILEQDLFLDMEHMQYIQRKDLAQSRESVGQLGEQQWWTRHYLND
jgi:hypothetical protein